MMNINASGDAASHFKLDDNQCRNSETSENVQSQRIDNTEHLNVLVEGEENIAEVSPQVIPQRVVSPVVRQHSYEPYHQQTPSSSSTFVAKSSVSFIPY